ncbi:MAG: MFS transporter, partial [Isosphaeraceae bacterium]
MSQPSPAAATSSGPSLQANAILLVLAAVQFTNIVDFMIVMPLGQQLMRSLAIDTFRFGLIVSSYTIAACVAGLIAAMVVDRFDRKRAFLSLYAGFLVGTLCCGLAQTYTLLLVARVVTGAFGGILGGMALSIVGDVFPEEKRGAATGALMSAFALASVAGVPLGIELGTRFDWHAPFFFLAALGTLILPIALFVLPHLRGHLEGAGAGHEGAVAELRKTLANPAHWRAFALVVSLMLGGFLVIPYISPYMVSNVGVSERSLSLLYMFGGASTLFAAPLIGRLADRYGKLQVYRIVAPAAALMMLAVTHLPRVGLPLAIAATAGLMVGNAGRMVVAMAMVTSCVEPRRRGSFMSVNSAVQHLSTGLGAFLGGAIVTKSADGTLTHFPLVGWL